LNTTGPRETKNQTPCPESASELYRPSDRRLSAKSVPTFADRGCRVDLSRKQLLSCTSKEANVSVSARLLLLAGSRRRGASSWMLSVLESPQRVRGRSAKLKVNPGGSARCSCPCLRCSDRGLGRNRKWLRRDPLRASSLHAHGFRAEQLPSLPPSLPLTTAETRRKLAVVHRQEVVRQCDGLQRP
jgi:hypothetical protein